MFSTPSAFASPLGPLHFAEPSSSTTSLASLFSRDASSSSKRQSRPSKRFKPSSTTISISGPVLLSSSNPLVGANSFEPSPSRAPSPPPSYGNASGTASPPPRPPYDALPPSPTPSDVDALLPRPTVDQHPLLPARVVESRFDAWDAERRVARAREVRERDGRVADEVRRLGL